MPILGRLARFKSCRGSRSSMSQPSGGIKESAKGSLNYQNVVRPMNPVQGAMPRHLSGMFPGEPPKYRCPRCEVQSCSLPCYKKHQQRASCSGKRDPAAYLKKSQLATPTGLDQDYNYLKDIEGSIQNAESEAQERGIGVSAASSKNVARGRQQNSKLQEYLTANQITVERAPLGMSRQKNNQTRPTRAGGILWSIEWVTTSGSLGTQHDCPESHTLAHLYKPFLAKMGNSESVNRIYPDEESVGQRGKKRRRVEPTPQRESLASQHAAGAIELEAEPQLRVADDIKSPDAAIPTSAPTAVRLEGAFIPMPSSVTQGDLTTGGDNSSVSQNHFYLSRPATVSSARILIPINGDASVTKCLRGKAIQEYPSIFVLDQGPDELPAGFMTEAKYLRLKRDADVRLWNQKEKTKVEHDSSAMSGAIAADPPSQELDAQSILNMLKRDVRG